MDLGGREAASLLKPMQFLAFAFGVGDFGPNLRSESFGWKLLKKSYLSAISLVLLSTSILDISGKKE